MFKEGQHYSPVAAVGQGEAKVILDRDHPGASDPAYQLRRNELAAMALAWRPGSPCPAIDYTDVEQEVWRTVCQELQPRHERFAIREFLEAKEKLQLPDDHIPALNFVTERLEPLTGFRLVPAAGLVPLRDFLGSLSERLFHSTQYLRHPASPLYTPEPDVIHEVIGHGHLLATPLFSELHRLAGEASRRLWEDENLYFLSQIFWFTLEFGVVLEEGEVRAYGAGILSSYGELEEFRSIELRPLDLAEMGTAEYDVTAYQPLLYMAESLDELRETVGGFFRDCTDDSIHEMRERAGSALGTAGTNAR